MAVAT